jgi:hypothetical protein
VVTFPSRGILFLQSFAGVIGTEVAVLRETPKRYVIQALGRTRLAGRRREILEGEVAWVPKSAVRLEVS